MNSITPNPSESQQSNVTNWKEIDLSSREGLEALNRVVAYRAGWRVYIGEAHGRRYAQRYDQQGKWQFTYWADEYSDYEGAAWIVMPHYTVYPDHALTLVELVKASFRLDSNAPGMWRAWFSPMGTMKNADTPALAICLAWLDWQDANGGQS